MKLTQLKSVNNCLLCCNVSDDGRFLIGSKEGILSVDLSSLQVFQYKLIEPTALESTAISRGGEYAAAGHRDCVFLWSPRGFYRSQKLHRGFVSSLSFSPNGDVLASGCGDGSVIIWHMKGLVPAHIIKKYTSVVYGVSFSYDGSRLVSVRSDGSANIWDVKTGTELLSFVGHTDFARDAAFSPCGRYIVTVGDDKRINVWDSNSGEKIRTMTGHKCWVIAVDWSPNGKLILTASYDDSDSVMVWEAGTGKLLHMFHVRSNVVGNVCWSEDSDRFFVANSIGECTVWDLNP